ncbi:hypothetical protein SDC9_211857 [bioreactor metagenome]|uniref:Trigger factor C-terminal domain-containing protein n=1 Tax=bioreactor metagenome TaxID=1076179 RepID=A0A645JKZ1_9ZZZZ
MELKNKLSEKDLKPKDTDVTALTAEIIAKNEGEITDQEAVNIAKKQLIDEAYDKMVERLVDSAEISK